MSSLHDELINDLGSSDESDGEHEVTHDTREDDVIDVSYENLSDEHGREKKGQNGDDDLRRHVPPTLLDQLNELELQVLRHGPDSSDRMIDVTEEQSGTISSGPGVAVKNSDGVTTPNDRRNANTDTKYQIVISCAAVVGQVDEVITSLHVRLMTFYRPGFPELETLVVNAMDYARVVTLAHQHHGDYSKIDLRPILPSASVITVQITASSTAGRKLTAHEWQLLSNVANAMLQLDRKRSALLAYIQFHASSVAPNLVAIVGGVVAAKLIAQVGGLEPLAAMPSGNLKVIGKTGSVISSSSSSTTAGSMKHSSDHPFVDDDRADHHKDSHKGRHDGFIHACPLVMQLPPKLRRKAGDIVAGKASLAARVDAQRSSRDGSMGQSLRQALDAKFIQMQERPPAKSAKPLPVPGDEAKRRHRGGARARKEKERLGLTEAWKLSNRVKFGVAETARGNDLENEGLGMLGAPDSQRLKVRTSKARGVSLAAKRKLEKHQKKEGISEAEKLGITSDMLFSVPPPVNESPASHAPPPNTVAPPPGVGFPGAASSAGLSGDGSVKPVNYFTPTTPFLGVDKKSRQIKKTT